MKRSRAAFSRRGFTLVEILIASIAAVIVLAAIYGVFVRAIKMRDNATTRIHDSRLRTRVANTLRNDLRNALISGSNGVFAVVLEAGRDGSKSRFPGYLRFTTTTGKDSTEEMFGDVQQVEYYIANDTTGSGSRDAGTLVRAVNRDLLSTVEGTTREDPLLGGVAAIDVSFFDGQNWQQTWQYASDNQTLPQAIRVAIQQIAPSQDQRDPLPIEVLVPWSMQPWTSGTATTTGT